MRKVIFTAFLFVLALSIPASAVIELMPVPEIAVNWGDGPGWQSDFHAHQDKIQKLAGHEHRYRNVQDEWMDWGDCKVKWTLEFDTDPFINATINVVNTSATTQTFTFTFSTPVDPIADETIFGGSTGGQINFNSSDGGTLSTVAGSPFYEGLMDDVSVLTFYDTDSWTKTYQGGMSINHIEDGLPTLTNGNEGDPLTTDIGIKHVFTLTPGDSVVINSFFEVLPGPAIPEPATLSLLGLGMILIRRKK